MEKELTNILDTINGSLNKQIINNFNVTRRTDGYKLSEMEIMQLTRPYFKMVENSCKPEKPDGEFYWVSPIPKQIQAIIDLASEISDVTKAARICVEAIIPMCNAMSESPDAECMTLYNTDQMITAFIAGQQWLRDRLEQKIPIKSITLEVGLDMLKEFLFSLPKDMSVKRAIDYLKQVDL